MMSQTIYLADETDTLALGASLAELFRPGQSVHLEGHLGAGKTTLVRGVLRAYGFTGTVKSPTYTLVEEYELQQLTLYHFDLYRLDDPEELEWMGIRDYFRTDSLCLIEWPERGLGCIPLPDFCIHLQSQGEGRQADIRRPDQEPAVA